MAWTLRHKLGLRMAVLLAVLAVAAGAMFVNFYEMEVTRQRLDRVRSVLHQGLRASERLEDLSLALGGQGAVGKQVRQGLEQAVGDIRELRRGRSAGALPGGVRQPLAELAELAGLLADPELKPGQRAQQADSLRLSARSTAQRLRLQLDEMSFEANSSIQAILKQQLILLAVVAGCLVLLAAAVFIPLGRAVLDQRRELKEARETLSRLAVIDPLTKAFNRRKLQEAGLLEVERSRRYKAPLSAVMFDIDGFRVLNEALGYEGGDRLLADLADLVRQAIRITDMLFRWRDGRFLILAPHIDADQAGGFAEKIRALVEASDLASGRKVTISLGYGQHHPGEDLDAFFSRIKQALAEAKTQGRNRAVMAPQLAVD
jgi:diguanylate cyclase (GGDEF)-like protein